MLEPQLREACLRLVAARTSGRGQFSINRDGGFPVARFLKEMRRVEARLVEPEEFVLHIGPRAFLDHPIVGR